VPAAPSWRLNPLLDLHWRIWGSSCVAFESVSGETRVVEPLEAAALACFEEGPQNLPRLVGVLATDLAVDPAGPLRDELQVLVQDCLTRGWLEAIESGE
jgi:hypothetical protein